MSNNTTFYRPAWTVGRYHGEKHVALVYNCISGFSHFFESHSADVIDLVLQAGKNGCVEVSQVADKTGISEESIVDFFGKLQAVGLLSPTPLNEADIAAYRKQCAAMHRQTFSVEKTTQEKLPMAVTHTEMSYADAVAGEGVVTSAMIELTYNCSEKCVHCYNFGATRNDSEQSHRADRQELRLDDYRRIIDQLYDCGVVRICLSGGDPFSKPEAWDIIDYLYQKEIAIDIFTNGQRLVGQEERLAAYFPHIVGVSIYSGKAEDHDAITRIPGSWQRSMQVVRRLSDLSVPLELKCCVMQPNLHSYYMVADIARQVGAQPQFEVNISDSNDGDQCARQLRLTEEQLYIVLRDNNIPMYVGPEAPSYGGQPKLMDQNACGAGKNSFCITPEGNLQCCPAFPMPFGNLKEKSLQEIIIGNEQLKAWKTDALKNYEECGQHDYCSYCNLCAGHNYIEHGDYHRAAENCCYMAKVRYTLAHRMMEGFDPLQGQEFASALQALPKAKVVLRRIYDTKG